jgi:hypothetical protein
VITTSAPILDDETPPRSEPAGVLAVTVDLRSLLEWLEPVRIDGGGVLIVDESNAVWWPSPVPDELAVQLPPHRELSRGRGTSVATHERDRGRRFLVSWSPVDGRGAGTLGELVVVVVQAERDAVRSLDEMHKKASGHAFWLGVFVATVVAAGWAALIVRRARAEATVYV